MKSAEERARHVGILVDTVTSLSSWKRSLVGGSQLYDLPVPAGIIRTRRGGFLAVLAGRWSLDYALRLGGRLGIGGNLDRRGVLGS